MGHTLIIILKGCRGDNLIWALLYILTASCLQNEVSSVLGRRGRGAGTALVINFIHNEPNGFALWI